MHNKTLKKLKIWYCVLFILLWSIGATEVMYQNNLAIQFSEIEDKAILDYQKGDYAKAISKFKQLSIGNQFKQPQRRKIDVLECLAQVYETEGDNAKALELRNKVQKLSPDRQIRLRPME